MSLVDNSTVTGWSNVGVGSNFWWLSDFGEILSKNII
jgi:hypothetical protein